MPRFAANLTTLFNEVPFPERFALAAEAGFRGVECLFPYEWEASAIAGELKRRGLVQVLFNFPPGDWSAGERGIAGLPGREAEFLESVETAIAYAGELGCRRLHVMAGIVPEGGSRAEHMAIYKSNLARAARRLAEEDIVLLIEPINTGDMPRYLLNRQGEAHEIVAELGEPNLKVQMDFYHAQIVEGDPLALFRKHRAGIGHIQIASVPERHEPDRGEVDYPRLFDEIDRAGYGGWIGCEYRPRGRTVDGLGWLRGRL